MAFNPSPKVAAARAVAKQFDQDQVIVVMLNYKENTIQTVSYGRTKRLCDAAAGLANAAYEAVYEELEDRAR